MKKIARLILLSALFIAFWQGIISLFDVPPYLLPTPLAVWQRLMTQADLLFMHAQITLLEILLGLFFGFLFGLSSALLLTLSRKISAFLMPLLVISQAIPVFAIAPLLVLWLGYGMASKITMAILIIYFPVTAACYDGLRNTPKPWLQLPKPCVFHLRQCYLKCVYRRHCPHWRRDYALPSPLRPLVPLWGNGSVLRKAWAI